MNQFFWVSITCIGVVFCAACSGNSKTSKDQTQDTGGISMNDAAEAKSPNDALFDEILTLHDEAMPKMGKLIGYQKKAQAAIDSLSKLSDAGSKQLRQDYEQLLGGLKRAEKGMNDWMEGFTPMDDNPNADSVKIYYEAEKIKAKTMRDDIFRILDSARVKLGE